MEKLYTVYMHTNKINNKVYVGITCEGVQQRWRNGKGYLRKDKENRFTQPKFARAIQKYGWDNFEHIIWAENLNHDDACRAEKLLIALWDSMNNGYNNTAGGEGTVGKKNSPECRKKISDARIGICVGKNNPRARKVAQYTIDGDLIKVWDYIRQASRNLGISESHIVMCCKNTFGDKTAGGFVWRYVEGEIIYKINKTQTRENKVVQLSKDGHIIRIWVSSAQASRELGIDATSIAGCCKHKPRYKTAGGFRWMYLEEYEKLQIAS